MRQSAASPEEAAAVVAAIEQFLRDTTPAPAPPERGMNPWFRAGLFENVGLQPRDPMPWGRA